MLVRMLRTSAGSPNGLTSNLYKKGCEYEIPKDLGEVFLKLNVAEDLTLKAITSAPENKEITSAPENKDIETAFEEKQSQSRVRGKTRTRRR